MTRRPLSAVLFATTLLLLVFGCSGDAPLAPSHETSRVSTTAIPPGYYDGVNTSSAAALRRVESSASSAASWASGDASLPATSSRRTL